MNLIERLENAPEGSRELDVRIECLVNPCEALPLGHTSETLLARAEQNGDWGGAARLSDTPHYTTSLDAALTLVPENVLSWKISDTPGGPHAWLYDGEREYDGYPNSGCGTPALALCIACFEARAELDEKERTG